MAASSMWRRLPARKAIERFGLLGVEGGRHRPDKVTWQGTGQPDIAVNCVTPAAAKTRIFDQMSEEHIDYMLSKIPRGRFLDVEEAAKLIVWAVSPENSFTTGAVFDLSGGRATY